MHTSKRKSKERAYYHNLQRDWDGYFEVDFAVVLHIWSHLVAAGVTCNCKRDKIRWRKGHARVGGGALPVEKKNQV
jgi:hypothetical protein